MQCDEYPFGKSYQGGDDPNHSSAMLVDAEHNSAQGGKYTAFLSHCGLRDAVGQASALLGTQSPTEGVAVLPGAPIPDTPPFLVVPLPKQADVLTTVTWLCNNGTGPR